MLPDVLDVPAALGSDMALSLLEDAGAVDFAGYSENMENLRAVFSEENDAPRPSSLYSGWLNTLRPLLLPKGEGYPVFMQNEEWVKKDLECFAGSYTDVFMQNEEWVKKDLECFAGSYTELKHDTVLYSKQVMAEMGGGWDEEPDDRGYVQPEPLVYERFAALAGQTAEGLSRLGMLSESAGQDLDWDEEPDDRGYVQPEPLVYERFAALAGQTAEGLSRLGMLSESAGQDLERLRTMAEQLLTISNKELTKEKLTQEEYEFIRSYGGYLEHFWYEIAKEESGADEGTYIESAQYPAAVVVDIATDPNGTGAFLV